MIIAEKKRKENIAEYLLYMYQVEDLIRANGFDLQKIDETIVSKFDTDYSTKREILEWYKGLSEQMISEKVGKKGHVSFILKLAADIDQLNQEVLNAPLRNDFKDAFDKARPHLQELRTRSGNERENDVQIALNALYGLLMLRLQKKKISDETTEAFKAISEWLSMLAVEFQNKERI